MDISREYLAGLFDGEGSVAVYGNGRTGHTLRVQIVQSITPTSEPLWSTLREIYGGGLTVVRREGIRPKMNLTFSGQKAAKFLTDIRPHTILKSDQIDVALTWYLGRAPVARGSNGRITGRTQEEQTEAAAVVALLREMKKA